MFVGACSLEILTAFPSRTNEPIGARIAIARDYLRKGHSVKLFARTPEKGIWWSDRRTIGGSFVPRKIDECADEPMSRSFLVLRCAHAFTAGYVQALDFFYYIELKT